MNAHALSGFSVKVNTVETRLVFIEKTWFRLSIHVVCHKNWLAKWFHEVSLRDKVYVCSAMRVTMIAGFNIFFLGGKTSIHKFGHHFMGTSPSTGEGLPVFSKTMQQVIPYVGVRVLQRKFHVTKKLRGSLAPRSPDWSHTIEFYL